MVATHDTRMPPLADRVVELVPAVGDQPWPETVTLEAGEVLFGRATGDSIYIVAEGEVELVRELASGQREIVKVAQPATTWRDGPVVRTPRTATARAGTDATVVGYTVQAFREMLGAGGSATSSSTSRWGGVLVRSGEDQAATAAMTKARQSGWRRQTEQQIRPDPLDAVITPAQGTADGDARRRPPSPDRQQHRRDVGQDAVTAPDRKAPASVGPPSNSTSVRSASVRSTSRGSRVRSNMVGESGLRTRIRRDFALPTTTRSGCWGQGPAGQTGGQAGVVR